MAGQIVPIQDIASAGIVRDVPSVSLPHNVYSDAENIRFHSNAVRKMEGEEQIVGVAPFSLDDTLVYIAYWKAPTTDYWIFIDETGTVYSREVDGTQTFIAGSFTNGTGTGVNWQHTLFNGGFNIILNNGVDVPMYLSDPVVPGTLTELPNWDSYLAQEEVTTVIWDEFNADISLGRAVDFTTESILYTVTPRDTSIGIINYKQIASADSLKPYTLITTNADNYMLTPRARTETQTGALPGDQITISIQTKASIQVRAGVIRSYGNLLIAGDLTEMEADDVDKVVRTLPGTIRTSDVAAPGQIPLNWNPFRNGANTADEFILSSTGKVQDMAELQGVMYVYTDVSIHGIQQTGNETIPFQISTVTDSYGCNSLGAVMEFDGRHLVAGSQDIYVFAGHPGSISSIADGRVRHHIYELENVAPKNLDINNVRMVRNQKYDEIWLFTPDRSQMWIWNYRNQSWTTRNQTRPANGSKGPEGPIFCEGLTAYKADVPGVYLTDKLTHYQSYVERTRLPMTPEFNTETLGSTALWYTSTEENSPPELTIHMEGSNLPYEIVDVSVSPKYIFNPNSDYKVDTRVQGRFINYRIDDGIMNNEPWNLTGYQLEIMQGGKR